jgi:hypothetical protein
MTTLFCVETGCAGTQDDFAKKKRRIVRIKVR